MRGTNQWTMIQGLYGLQQVVDLNEFKDICKHLAKHLEPFLVNHDRRKRNKNYRSHEGRIVLSTKQMTALPKWTHESSGHVVADSMLKQFNKWLHTTRTDEKLGRTLQPIVERSPCRSWNPGDLRDRGLYSTLPMLQCASRILHGDCIEVPNFGGYDCALLVICGLTSYT